MNARDWISTTLCKCEGWCSPEKATRLVELIEATRPAVVVELGVFGARSLIPMALALEALGSGRAWGIDPYTEAAVAEGDSDPVNQQWWAKLDLTAIMRGAVAALQAAGVDRRVVLLPMTGSEAAPLFPLASIDLLHIDSNHSEIASVRDVTEWLPRVRSNGHIVMDDISWATMQRAVAMMRERCELVEEHENWAIFRQRTMLELVVS